MHFEMQMRASGAAAHADIADRLALLDLRAAEQVGVEATHMRIGGFQRAVMADADIATITALEADFFHRAGTSGENGRAGRSAEIDAFMHFAVAEDRMHTHAEPRGNARGRNRRAQQSAADAAALLIEIIDAVVTEGHAIDRLDLAADMQCRINDGALADRLALSRGGLVVKNFEAVAGMNVALEVDVMGIGVDQRG